MRKKFIKLLFVTTIIFAFLQISSYAETSTYSHWAYENYLIAKEDNWLIGEDGGGFSFDKASSRERAIATLVQAWENAVNNGKTSNYLKSAPADTLNNFTDVSKISPRFKDAVATAVANGIIKGDANKINPKSSITRAEFAVILSRIVKSNTTSGKSVFKDNLPDWAKDGILKAYSVGLIKGYSDNTFKPGLTITNSEALTMIKRWAYGEDIYTVLNDTQIKRLMSYPVYKGESYLDNASYRKDYKTEFHQLAKAAKDYVTVMGTYNYKDLQDTQKREALKDFYLKYSISPVNGEKFINTYIDDIIKNKRVKTTRFLLSSSTIYKDGKYKATRIKGIEESVLLGGVPESKNINVGKKYQQDIELTIVKSLDKTTLLFVNNLSEPMLVK
ncbi:MAG: S-layer homology domain-containing protein [Ignavibacteriales bacterium]